MMCVTCVNTAITCTWCMTGLVYVESTNQCILPNINCPAGTIKDPNFALCRGCE